jgi:hypothetical protein
VSWMSAGVASGCPTPKRERAAASRTFGSGWPEEGDEPGDGHGSLFPDFAEDGRGVVEDAVVSGRHLQRSRLGRAGSHASQRLRRCVRDGRVGVREERGDVLRHLRATRAQALDGCETDAPVGVGQCAPKHENGRGVALRLR